MNKRIQIIIAVVITIIVLSIGYYFWAATNEGVVVRLVTNNPPVEGGLILAQNERRNWDPDSIELILNKTITFVIVNNDDIEDHQFAIPELNFETKPIHPFESITIKFTPNKVGTFTFIDSRPEETYTYVDYRGETINQVVDHSVELGKVIIKP